MLLFVQYLQCFFKNNLKDATANGKQGVPSTQRAKNSQKIPGEVDGVSMTMSMEVLFNTILLS
jgi:hypothetical protein